jgi:hypothetical protein
MRPSEEPASLFILDEKPELELVLDFLEDPTTEKPPVGPGIDDFVISTGYRFRTQTQYELPPTTATDSGTDKWKENAEFRVEADDLEFVKRAALRVLNQKGMAYRFYNRLSRRDTAARHILEHIASLES